MTPDTINTLFYVTVVAGLGIGIALMALWGMRFAYPRAMRRMQGWKRVDVRAVAGMMFVYMLPGLLLFVLCCIPLLYMAGLRKQVPYCVELIRVNDLERDDPILAERCSGIDIESLFRMAAERP